MHSRAKGAGVWATVSSKEGKCEKKTGRPEEKHAQFPRSNITTRKTSGERSGPEKKIRKQGVRRQGEVQGSRWVSGIRYVKTKKRQSAINTFSRFNVR